MNYLRMYYKSEEKLAVTFLKTVRGQITQAAIADKAYRDELENSLSQIDIEILQGDDALLLAYAQQQHKELNVGSYNKPRLKGLIKYCQFSNLNQMSFFSGIVGILNDYEIIPSVSYDMAMKYYRPDSYRFLTEAEIMAESDEQYDRIREVLSALEYEYKEEGTSFVILEKRKKNGRKVRVFKGFSLHGDDSSLPLKIIRSHCSAVNLAHTQCYVPSAEDIVLIALDRISKKLYYDAGFHGVAFDIWDLCYMVRQHNISQDTMKAALSKYSQCRFAARFVNKIVPDLFPTDVLMENILERISRCMGRITGR